MATARKLPSGSWRCQVYSHTESVLLPDGTKKERRVYKSFTNDDPSSRGKRKCEAEAAAWAANKPATRSSSQMTFGDALDEYIVLRSEVLSPATIREYKRSRNRDVQGLMDLKLDRITQADVQKAINLEALTHSPKSVRNMHGLVSAVLECYRPDFRLRTKLPQKVRTDEYIPTDDDIRKLMETVAGTAMEIPILLAAFGPMRRGEICALEVEDISGTVVHVHRALVIDEKKRWVSKPPKTLAGDRYIDFPPFVIEKLLQVGSGRVTQLNPNALSSRFVHVLDHAGVPHFRFHALRHYAASMQHAIGVPDAYILQRGGWSSDQVMKTVYRHALADEQLRQTQMINDALTDKFKR